MQGNCRDTGSKTLWIASLKPIAQSKDITVRILPSAATWHRSFYNKGLSMHKLDHFPTWISHKQNLQVKIGSSLHKQNSPVAIEIAS